MLLEKEEAALEFGWAGWTWTCEPEAVFRVELIAWGLAAGGAGYICWADRAAGNILVEMVPEEATIFEELI